MVTIHFKLTDTGTVQLDVSGPESLESLLERCEADCALELGGFIAVRKSRIITGKDLVEDFDEIEIFPALSGG